MFKIINEMYKSKTGNNIDFNIELKLDYDEDRYSDKVIYKNVTFSDSEVDKLLYKLGKIIYKNMLVQRKAGVL